MKHHLPAILALGLAAAFPTDQRHAAFAKGGSDPGLATLYFNFCP